MKHIFVAVALLSPTFAFAQTGIATSVSPGSATVVIAGCCTIHQDGKVELAEGAKLDDASRAFWAAISQFGMQNCRPVEGTKP